MNDFIKVSDIARFETRIKDDNGNVESYIPLSKITDARKYNVKEEIKSYWTVNETNNKLKFSCTCNNCNQTTKEGAFTITPDYCPYCGATMINK